MCQHVVVLGTGSLEKSYKDYVESVPKQLLPIPAHPARKAVVPTLYLTGNGIVVFFRKDGICLTVIGDLEN